MAAQQPLTSVLARPEDLIGPPSAAAHTRTTAIDSDTRIVRLVNCNTGLFLHLINCLTIFCCSSFHVRSLSPRRKPICGGGGGEIIIVILHSAFCCCCCCCCYLFFKDVQMKHCKQVFLLDGKDSNIDMREREMRGNNGLFLCVSARGFVSG
ncbi:hypothetical protein DFP73DRAFT_147010 [Morchella snyderi]|nr:hypothetical protein DFP73DRAFT_147010 [Morchella snyderi]